MSPLQNRVTPLSELVADPGRGLVFGNRGRLHDPAGHIVRSFDGQRWIACRLAFRGRHRLPMPPGRYTGLFFLDEATALAAGHRPCAECRHEDYRSFVSAWSRLHVGETRADAIDARLHAERLDETRRQRHHQAPVGDLVDGAFVIHGGAIRLVFGDSLLRWTPAGYTERSARPRSGSAEVITPPSLIALLAAGWRSSLPLLHPSAFS